MTDQLTRAWGLLREGERPPGLNWSDEYGFFHERGYSTPHHVAYDRLCKAVEDVVIKEGFGLSLVQQKHWWTRVVADGGVRFDSFAHPDRLTAACDALASVRKEAERA